ncbi:hypothetical protein [Helicobacter saguini]|uniref:hypothetical protein n=1 Tax=Helicobacter saguini TaxID=1548018 RepID=UPI00051388C9
MKKPYEKITHNFKDFLDKNGLNAFKNLKIFFYQQKENFYSDKIQELELQGLSKQEATIKARPRLAIIWG